MLSEGIGELVNLEELILNGCEQVETLPESLCDLRRLVKLQISGYNPSGFNYSMKLKSLPERFGDLNLTEIDFGYCTSLDLGVIFDVIFKFQGLTKLGLAGLKMESLPERKPQPPLNCLA